MDSGSWYVTLTVSLKRGELQKRDDLSLESFGTRHRGISREGRKDKRTGQSNIKTKSFPSLLLGTCNHKTSVAIIR